MSDAAFVIDTFLVCLFIAVVMNFLFGNWP